ncbi:MAG TPA: hypothetical protein PLI18_15420 [Pirellulaceae bacterium]|nr:hypothetical protein [Pirellulaceae bacterium]
MARTKSTDSKSALIRAYRAAHPNAKPRAIAEALSKKGLEITPAYVSVILSLDRKKAGEPRRRRGAAGRPAMSTESAARRPVGRPRIVRTEPTLVALASAKNLLDVAGSVASARRAIDAFAQLIGKA